MSNELLSEQLRAAVRLAVEQSRRRGEAEALCRAERTARLAAATQEFQEAGQRLQSELAARQTAAGNRLREVRQGLAQRFEQEHAASFKEYSARRLKANGDFDVTREALDARREETRWTVETIFEADKRVAKEEYLKLQRLVGTSVRHADASYKEFGLQAARWDLDGLMRKVRVAARADQLLDAVAALQECVATQDECLARLQRFRAPRLLRGPWLLLLFLAVWLVLLLPAAFGIIDEWYYWATAVTAAVISTGFVIRFLLAHNLHVRFVQLCQLAKQTHANAEALKKRALEQAGARHQSQSQQAKSKREAALRKAEGKHAQGLEEATRKRDQELKSLAGRYEPALEKLAQERDAAFRRTEAEYQQEMAAANQQYEAALADATRRRDEATGRAEQEFQKAWQTLRQQWEGALAEFARVAAAVRDRCARLFPPWESLQGKAWPAPAAVPPAMRFGELRLGLDAIPGGIPENKELRASVPAAMPVPALLGFPERGSLLIKAGDEGRAEAVALLQALMLRCLTSLPPGKVRFTILDPVGLGENFAAFAHLADFDEKLVASRIWSEPPHIEQRLADLTEHIETVIQKYLRNEFETLEQYNAQAGEIAEPYRILVVANFPVNFGEESARRLQSIAASGARCGIHTLILWDTRQDLPRTFEVRDLEQVSSVLAWGEGGFAWQDPDFGRFPLRLDTPPPAELCTSLLQTVGERARLAGRVEIPFQQIAPPPQRWWTGDSRRGIRVALGKAGATRQQLLELGEGTAQHVLIAGKTGSGKSTLLHALIVQLALTYSPDEVELYLIDFKKGVEFKTYARHELPHARVVAIESEREFGLSVLQRLDQELRARGERFRARGVNDVPAYRAAAGDDPMPRVLLIVDEFQEFFVEDDRTAQESALLLDRLVRQGRAFGIHILLGSQTLGGAYSLARTTIDQMAVRIALQCSEADGHLILSKENSAARLLSRPGEAIYNNANGLLEGNNLFQTVWLSEQKRDECLAAVAQKARQTPVRPRPLLVFEGNAPAHLERNPHIEALARDGAPERAGGAEYTAWLGDAIAIKEPTAAAFRRQSGSNLLLVGQHPEAALAVLSASLLSLGLQARAAGGRLHVLCHGAGDERAAAYYRRLVALFPDCATLAGWNELPAAMAALASEVDQRLAERSAAAAPRFLLVHGLQHFRDLRRPDDDFGYSRRDDKKPVSPAKLLSTVLREGPTVGVHALVWCDTVNNLQRAFDRQLLREFEMRVLFQMNANDSSNLIDSPLASKLGLYRALYYTEDQGRTEKFRPYGLPPEEWLAQVRRPAASATPEKELQST